MKKTIVSVLDKAGSELRRHSIVFPALGRDGLKYPPAKVVWCMISSIVEYFRDSPGGKSSSLEEVSIVCNGRDEEVKTVSLYQYFRWIKGSQEIDANKKIYFFNLLISLHSSVQFDFVIIVFGSKIWRAEGSFFNDLNPWFLLVFCLPGIFFIQEFENRLHTAISPARKLSCDREDSATSSTLTVPGG